MKIKDYFILGLIAIIILSFVFNNKIGIVLGLSEERVDTLRVQEEVLSQKIIDSLALIPILQWQVDSLENTIVENDKRLVIISKKLSEALKQAEEFTPTEDVKFFTESTDDIRPHVGIPRLVGIDGTQVVIVSPDRIKTANMVFISHDAYLQERPILFENIKTLEDIKAKQKREIDVLMNTMSLQDERYENNQEQIKELNQQVNFHKKRTKKRTIGAITIGALAVGATILILK